MISVNRDILVNSIFGIIYAGMGKTHHLFVFWNKTYTQFMLLKYIEVNMCTKL